MVQNRNRLIELFIGNMSNAVVHDILAKAIEEENIRNYYSKELKTSLDVAKRYREMINPINATLPEKDIYYIKDKITRRVMAELQLRIAKGYDNIDLALVNPIVEEKLKELKIN